MKWCKVAIFTREDFTLKASAFIIYILVKVIFGLWSGSNPNLCNFSCKDSKNIEEKLGYVNCRLSKWKVAQFPKNVFTVAKKFCYLTMKKNIASK